MSGDSTRYSLDLTRHPAGVLFGQGRVLTDADVNELVELLDRRLRTGTLDAEGPLLFSAGTPDAYMLSLAGGKLAIGPGRAYVDGIQAECFGAGPQADDPAAENATGTTPVPYDQQPYFSDRLPPLPNAGTHLVYLDVWRREQGFWNAPELVDPAIGFDTSTRLQTVWQVRVLPDSQPGLNCDTPDSQVTGWAAATRPSAGRLTTDAVGVPSSDDPCVVAPSGGYRGVGNRHYRVQVHQGGPLGTATFVWSRDNGSIRVPAIGIDAARTQLTVTRTGRDTTLRFAIGDWVEVTDDHRELAGLAGELRRVMGVDDVAQTLTLAGAALAADLDPADPSRRTRVIRWDQKGDVLDPAGAKVDDVESNGGFVKVPATPGAKLVLEDGVQVQFTVDAAAGTSLHAGDAWSFAARTADGSVQQLTAAAPRSVRHHYARLGVWTPGHRPVNCRPQPPAPVEDHDCCDCTVCVTPESHASGTLTLQAAVDQIGARGGKVCVAPGDYRLDRTLVLARKRALTIQGHGVGTLIRHDGAGPAVLVTECLEARLEDLAIVSLRPIARPDRQTGAPPDGVVRIMSSLWIDVDRCVIADLGALSDVDGPRRAAVVLDGIVAQVSVRDNVLFGRIGVLGFADADAAGDEGPGSARGYLLTLDLALERNVVLALGFGVMLGGEPNDDGLLGLALHLLQTRIVANVVLGASRVGILSFGAVGSGARAEITANTVATTAQAIVVGSSRTLIADNEIRMARRAPAEGELVRDGIGITAGLGTEPLGPTDLVIRANGISGPSRFGISINERALSARVEDNRIHDAGTAGISVEMLRRPIGDLLIAGNEITGGGLGLAAGALGAGWIAGIRVEGAERLELRDNRVTGLGARAGEGWVLRGIDLVAVADARVSGNVITDLGPGGPFRGTVIGIDVRVPFDRLDIIDNAVRPARTRETQRRSTFYALRIDGPDPYLHKRRLRVQEPGTVLATSGMRRVPTAVLHAAIDNDVAVAFDPSGNAKELLGPVLAVRGNRLEAAGDVESVLIGCFTARGAVGDNHVTLATPGGTPAVRMRIQTLVFDANIVDVPARDKAVVLEVNGPYTVLGNVASGSIFVGGGPLQPPWRDLNTMT